LHPTLKPTPNNRKMLHWDRNRKVSQRMILSLELNSMKIQTKHERMLVQSRHLTSVAGAARDGDERLVGSVWSIVSHIQLIEDMNASV
jgi:hypothetical protein